MIRILQITDPHILGKKDGKFLGMNPLTSFKAVMTEVEKDCKKTKPELIILSGDLSHDQSILSYHNLADEIKNLPTVFAWTPGNHDNPVLGDKILAKIDRLSKEKVFLFDQWKIIILNSYYPSHVSGFLGSGELFFLTQELKKDSEKNVAIFLHHPVEALENCWLDKIRTENYSEFLSIVAQYPSVKMVVCGHVHLEAIVRKHKIDFIFTPATSVQFKRAPQFELDPVMPGYRWFNLYPNGKYKTGVSRIKKIKELVPDLTVRGY